MPINVSHGFHSDTSRKQNIIFNELYAILISLSIFDILLCEFLHRKLGVYLHSVPERFQINPQASKNPLDLAPIGEAPRYAQSCMNDCYEGCESG